MPKHVFGLDGISIGTIAGDGGVATDFVEVGETVIASASMTMEDNTVTDFNIEESDSPVESVVSAIGKVSLAWSTLNVDSATLVKLLGGTATAPLGANRIATLGSITAGTGYANGTYSDVPLTGGAGTGATANITVAGTVVTAVTIVNRGAGYAAANTLTAAAANIGGTGTGFSIPVATVTAAAVAEKWEAPDSFPDIERSIQVVDKKGNIVTFPRAKIATKLGLSFTKEKLGQLDMSATILQPSKSGTKRITIDYAS